MATVEATTQKVQRILADEYNDVRLRKNGGFLVPGREHRGLRRDPGVDARQGRQSAHRSSTSGRRSGAR